MAHVQRQVKRTGHKAVLLFPTFTCINTRYTIAKSFRVHKVKEKLTASNLTTVSIFRTEGSVSILTMMSPAGRERVRGERLGEERGCEPPLVRTM